MKAVDFAVRQSKQEQDEKNAADRERQERIERHTGPEADRRVNNIRKIISKAEPD